MLHNTSLCKELLKLVTCVPEHKTQNSHPTHIETVSVIDHEKKT